MEVNTGSEKNERKQMESNEEEPDPWKKEVDEDGGGLSTNAKCTDEFILVAIWSLPYK